MSSPGGIYNPDGYSYLNVSTGFARAAERVRKLMVASASNSETSTDAAKIHIPNSMR